MTLILKWLAGTAGPWILLAVIVVTASGWAAAGWQTVQLNKAMAAHQKHIAEDEAKARKASEDARSKEQRNLKKSTQNEAQRLQEQENEKAAYERTIADLKSGALRLRRPANVSCAGSAGSDQSSTGGGIKEGDSIVSADSRARILRKAGEADEIVVNLASCVRQLRIDRGLESPVTSR